MRDTEALNLIEHYGWKVQRTLEYRWAVDGDFGSIRGETLREAIKAAINAQMEWALDSRPSEVIIREQRSGWPDHQ